MGGIRYRTQTETDTLITGAAFHTSAAAGRGRLALPRSSSLSFTHLAPSSGRLTPYCPLLSSRPFKIRLKSVHSDLDCEATQQISSPPLYRCHTRCHATVSECERDPAALCSAAFSHPPLLWSCNLTPATRNLLAFSPSPQWQETKSQIEFGLLCAELCYVNMPGGTFLRHLSTCYPCTYFPSFIHPPF